MMISFIKRQKAIKTYLTLCEKQLPLTQGSLATDISLSDFQLALG